MKKKFNQLLDSKKFTGYLILVLFSAVALITALIFGSDTRKNEILTNSLKVENQTMMEHINFH